MDDCDVVAAVTQLDNTNLMVAEVASRLFGVPHVIARLYNPDHERAYMQLGIDYVCGTSLVAEDVFSKVVSGHGAHIDTFGEFGARVRAPRAYSHVQQIHPGVGAHLSASRTEPCGRSTPSVKGHSCM